MSVQSRFQYRSLFWPLILIGIGVVWLLSNVGILSAASMVVLVRLWPLILIVIGLDLLFGRQSPALGALLGLGAVAVIIVLMLVGPSLGWAGDMEVKTSTYSEPLSGTKTARVNLEVRTAYLNITPLTDSANLMEADIRYTGQVEFASEEAGGARTVSLTQKAEGMDFGIPGFLMSAGQDLRWNIGLNSEVLLDVNIDLGTGGASLDLTDLQITHLEMDAGTGGVDASLPTMRETYTVRIGAGTGGGAVRIPEGAALTLTISSGMGGFTVDVPDGSAVRLEASTGIGGIAVPASLARVSGGADDSIGERGVWETEGFAGAERKIIIRFDGGTGGLTVS